ncbi:hypothetical protein ACLB2K_046500 [Fragaria x ananassa]
MRPPVESLCRVQCVSKTSFDISRSPEFATLHNLPSHDSAMDSLMRVTTWSNAGRHDFVFCNLVFLKREIGTGPCLLVNPLREEVLELRHSNIPVRTTHIYSEETNWYGMGYDDITSTYKIIHVWATKNCVVAQVLVLGASSWRQIHLAPPFDVGSSFPRKRSQNGIYVGGHMHWLIYKTTERPGYMISFNFNSEEFCVTLVPSSSYGLYLLKFRGSLALVDVHYVQDMGVDKL